jgi:hypothetical protein
MRVESTALFCAAVGVPAAAVYAAVYAAVSVGYAVVMQQ